MSIHICSLCEHFGILKVKTNYNKERTAIHVIYNINQVLSLLNSRCHLLSYRPADIPLFLTSIDKGKSVIFLRVVKFHIRSFTSNSDEGITELFKICTSL